MGNPFYNGCAPSMIVINKIHATPYKRLEFLALLFHIRHEYFAQKLKGFEHKAFHSKGVYNQTKFVFFVQDNIRPSEGLCSVDHIRASQS